MEQAVEHDITAMGDPSKPKGSAGSEMLSRMNESHRPVTEWALGLVDFRESDRVLDIGCGGGATLRRLSKRVGKEKGQIAGVDYSSVSVSESIKFNQDLVDEGRLSVVEGSVEQLPFPDGTFDKITTVESFYFWPDHVNSLKEVRRVLKKGGKFLLVADIHGGADLSPKEIDNVKKYNLFNPSPEEYQELFQQAGFFEIQIHLKKGEKWICVTGSKG